MRNFWFFLTSKAWPWPALTVVDMGLVEVVEDDGSIRFSEIFVAFDGDGDGRWPFVMVYELNVVDRDPVFTSY